MLGIVSYGLFLAIIGILMRVVTVGSGRERANAAATMLASRVQ